MKPRVLALDFDGTIAVNATVDANVAAAIQEARRAGLLTVLVTGRMLSDLEASLGSPPLFDAVVKDTNNTSTGYSMYGHSAGAQFVHRFLLFERGNRVEHAISANAGWYTAVDNAARFPYGLKESPARPSVVKALGFPLVLLLGEEDNDPESDGLRTTPGAMAQGAHRLARGRYFYETGRAAARRLHVPFRWRLITVPNAGHHDEEMAPTAASLLFGVA